MKTIILTESEKTKLLKARKSLLSNSNESVTKHSANNKLFADVAEKYGVSSQHIWDAVSEISKQK